LSVIAPAHNEQDNIPGLVADVHSALAASGLSFEFIIIDDGSTDQTRARLLEQAAAHPWIRIFAMTRTPPGKGNGQSAAFHAGIRQAHGRLIALLDADRQNDPTDLPAMVHLLRQTGAHMVQGDRSANRRDTAFRRFSSWVGRTFRGKLLGDSIRDTGCSLRVFVPEIGLALPLQYKGMHRFIPFYARMLGFTVVEMAVNHRPRTAGVAKYGAWNRALPGLRDLFAVRWMRTRLRPVTCQPCEPTGRAPAASTSSAAAKAH
jgi:glycosyltransferase involved in cell wall biosynthesis